MLIENHSCSCPDALFELAMREAKGRALHARYVTDQQLEDIIDKSLNKFNLLKYRETYDLPKLIDELRDELQYEWYDLAHEASCEKVYELGFGSTSLIEAITGTFEKFNLVDGSLDCAEEFLEDWAELNCEEDEEEDEEDDEEEAEETDIRYAYLTDESDPAPLLIDHESLYYQFAEDLEKRYGQVDWKDEALYFEEGPFLCRLPSLDEVIDKMECIRQPDVPAFLRRQIKRKMAPMVSLPSSA